MAYLQPFLNPGSKPRTTLPLTGGISNNLFKLAANTSTDAFSAFFESSFLEEIRIKDQSELTFKGDIRWAAYFPLPDLTQHQRLNESGVGILNRFFDNVS